MKKLSLLLLTLAMSVPGCDRPSRAVDADDRSRTESATADASTSRAKAAPSALNILEVRPDLTGFDPAKGEKVDISFRIDKPAKVRLNIFDGRNRLVRLVDAGQLPAGEHRLTWDGLDGKGRAVPPEAYVYTLIAVNERGDRVIHDLTDITGGEAVAAKDVQWNAASGALDYRLEKPARVNVRFGLANGGPHLHTLVDWVPRTAGTHSEAWDGWDANRVLRIASHPMLSPSVTGYSLPENTLFVGGPVERIAFADLTDEIFREQQSSTRNKRMAFHVDQPLDTRGDLSISLKVEGSAAQDADGRWIVSGQVPIRLDVAAEDRQRLLERRFEQVFYVDGLYTFENEVGVLPMTWNWDTSNLSEGEHFVTVNARGYEGNFGTATARVWVKRQTGMTKQ